MTIESMSVTLQGRESVYRCSGTTSQNALPMYYPLVRQHRVDYRRRVCLCQIVAVITVFVMTKFHVTVFTCPAVILYL